MAFSSQDNLMHPQFAIGELTTLRLSLHKFSCSTTPVGHKTAVWSHLKKDNLFAVFNHVSSRTNGGLIEKRPILSILQAEETLETICLKDLLQQVRVDEARLGDSQVSDSSRNILIIIRKPLVSFRFRLPDGETRRLQLNFAAESGYEHAVKTLLATTLPIRDQNVQIGSSVLSQTTAGSHRSETQDRNVSKPLTFTTIIENPEAKTNTDCNLPSSPSTGPSTTDDHGNTPTTLASYPRVQSSAGRLEKKSESDRTLRPYQLHSEPTRHPQFSVICPVNQESLNAGEPEPLRPSSAPVVLANLSIDMLSQILPPKRDLPFAVVPAKRTRPEADSSSTIEESATAVKAVRKVKKDLAKVAPKRVPTQRARKKKIPPKSARPEASTADKSTSDEVAGQEANLRGVTPEQVPPREMTPKQALPEPPMAKMSTTVNTMQDMPARFTRTSSKARTSQKTSSQSSKPSSPELAPENAQSVVPWSTRKEATTQTSAVDVPQLLMPISGNANAAPRLNLSQEWVDRVDEHIREARIWSIPEPVSESALVLASRPVSKSDLQVYATRPWEERQVGLNDAILDAIMDDNFVALCEDVEKVLEGMLRGDRVGA
ncbi:hypothetical protein MMC17_005487 [Xylographa soralifera]|nr:hypothetical protein [Xylographa soralifera]